MVRVKNAEEIRDMIKHHPMDLRRVFTIAAHIDHGKTTTSDFLLRRAGLMSDADAGKKVMMDSDEEEQERGITIFTSVVLLNYDYDDKQYLFEINDTPGHISFTGEVSRALRGSDGVILLVDALEGVMTQTETNIRLSIGEMCKPVLFISPYVEFPAVDTLNQHLCVSKDLKGQALLDEIKSYRLRYHCSDRCSIDN